MWQSSYMSDITAHHFHIRSAGWHHEEGGRFTPGLNLNLLIILVPIRTTHNVLSDEAVSFVWRAPGNLHLPVLTVVTSQLQVPGWVRHCRIQRCTYTHYIKWKDGLSTCGFDERKKTPSWVFFLLLVKKLKWPQRNKQNYQGIDNQGLSASVWSD